MTTTKHSGQDALFTQPLSDHEGPDENVEHGEVFTRRWVVELILDMCGYTADRDLAAMRALEPSCGTGAFLIPMVERVVQSAGRHERPIADAMDAIDAGDLLPQNVNAARDAVKHSLAQLGVNAKTASSLAHSWVKQRDFLLDPPAWHSADFVVGNPPYIRMESVPKGRANAYRQACPTMGGRADIYVGFYETGLNALKDAGVLGFICADRWLRNQYGARLRTMIGDGWSVDALVSMTGVDAFEEEVDAYPAITVIRRASQHRGPFVVSTSTTFGPDDAPDIARLASKPPTKPVRRARFEAARLDGWFKGEGGWPYGTPAELALIADLETTYPSLEDIETGTRLGIGIATGADKIFITDEAGLVESERLVRLAFPADITNGYVEWSGRYLINPWGQHGLVDLEDWPKLSMYFGAHRDQLAKRHTAKRGQWFRTIDRLVPHLAERPKLYLPDFRDRMAPVLDEGLTYPHHNLYWVTSDNWDLKVLGGLLMSDVANRFIEAYSVRMRGGFLRFQAQYLRRIRVPRLDTIDARSAECLTRAFVTRDHELATATALPLYGLSELPR